MIADLLNTARLAEDANDWQINGGSEGDSFVLVGFKEPPVEPVIYQVIVGGKPYDVTIKPGDWPG